MNNWLSFPQSPTHSSLQTNLRTSQSHYPSLGLISDHNNDHPFQIQGWNSIGSNGGGEVPKVEDFLGVGKTDNPPDFPAFNHIPATHSDYLFSNCTLQSGENSGIANAEDYNCHTNTTNLQSLKLTMGSSEGLNAVSSSVNAIEVAPRKSVDTFGQRTSIYRGVTKHRWTGRYEAHLWDNSCRREGQSRKGRQVYLGGYDKEEKAARAYDLAALKYWGISTTTNFPISSYERELDEMKHMTRQEYVASLRRKSSGFSRGASMYRGVTRHHQHGRWQVRIGSAAGNKHLYLGTFGTEEEAAEAYDIAAIKFRGLNAVTNFEMNRYDVHSIIQSNTLPIGGASKRLKEPEQIEPTKRDQTRPVNNSCYLESFVGFHGYPSMAMQFDQPQPLSIQNPHAPQIHQNYIHPSLLNVNLDPQFHQNYFHSHPAFVHNLVAMGGALTVDNNASSSSSSYNGGFVVDGFPMAANSSAENLGGIGQKPGCMESEYVSGDLGLVKVDYDMSLGGYGNWSGADSVRGPNHAGFNMWNDP